MTKERLSDANLEYHAKSGTYDLASMAQELIELRAKERERLYPEPPIQHRIYTHVKTGNQYEVLYDATETTNGSREGRGMVVYRRIGQSAVYVREASEFHDKFVSSGEPASRESPADLVGALQDVVHKDPGPVRAGHASREAPSAHTHLWENDPPRCVICGLMLSEADAVKSSDVLCNCGEFCSKSMGQVHVGHCRRLSGGLAVTDHSS